MVTHEDGIPVGKPVRPKRANKLSKKNEGKKTPPPRRMTRNKGKSRMVRSVFVMT